MPADMSAVGRGGNPDGPWDHPGAGVAQAVVTTSGHVRGYGNSVVGITLFVSNAILGLTSVSTWMPGASALSLLDRRTSTLLFWPILFTVAAPGIPYLIWKSRVETAANRRKIAWFVASVGIALSPIVIAVLLTPFIPALAAPEWRAIVGAILVIALASMVPTTAYAVAVSQVLDLHLVIRRTLQYGLAKTSVWCAILLPLLYLLFDIYNNRSLRVEEYLTVRRPFEPLLLSLVSFVILTFRHQILQHVDRWFSRDASDHTESLARLEQGLRSARTIQPMRAARTSPLERPRPADRRSLAVRLPWVPAPIRAVRQAERPAAPPRALSARDACPRATGCFRRADAPAATPDATGRSPSVPSAVAVHRRASATVTTRPVSDESMAALTIAITSTACGTDTGGRCPYAMVSRMAA